MNKSEHKVVLITGACGGIGRATVQLFTTNGWIVLGVDRSPFGEGFPATGRFYQVDITDPQAVETIFKSIGKFSPVLDAVVNNAAVQVAKPLIDTTVEEWDAVMASNLRPAFLIAKLVYPFLKKGGGGAIVNVSSVHAVQTSANIAC